MSNHYSEMIERIRTFIFSVDDYTPALVTALITETFWSIAIQLIFYSYLSFEDLTLLINVNAISLLPALKYIMIYIVVK
jgi:hypothetical protein